MELDIGGGHLCGIKLASESCGRELCPIVSSLQGHLCQPQTGIMFDYYHHWTGTKLLKSLNAYFYFDWSISILFVWHINFSSLVVLTCINLLSTVS